MAVRDVETEIERTREKVLTSLAQLKREIHDVVDWRERLRKRPWPYLAGALGLGVLVGLASGRARR